MKKASLIILSLIIADYSLAKPLRPAKAQYEFRPSNDYEIVSNGIRYISTAAGIASEIVFEEGETIEAHNFGFSAAWESEVVANGRILVFRSKDAQPETNLLVHTNRRSYVFLLVTGNNKWERNPTNSKATFSTRFNYPENENLARNTPQFNQQNLNKNLYFDYEYRATDNAKDLIPTKIYDDGILTYISFPNGSQRGSIYRLDAKNRPYLLNSSSDKAGNTVIHGVYQHYIIRVEDEAVEIRRNSDSGIYENFNKTNINNTYRTISPNAAKQSEAETKN